MHMVLFLSPALYLRVDHLGGCEIDWKANAAGLVAAGGKIVGKLLRVK